MQSNAVCIVVIPSLAILAAYRGPMYGFHPFSAIIYIGRRDCCIIAQNGCILMNAPAQVGRCATYCR